jgi:hypothetical protein
MLNLILLIYKKIYHNNLELKEIYTKRSKQVHNVYRFMYHYICKLRIKNLHNLPKINSKTRSDHCYHLDLSFPELLALG